MKPWLAEMDEEKTRMGVSAENENQEENDASFLMAWPPPKLHHKNMPCHPTVIPKPLFKNTDYKQQNNHDTLIHRFIFHHKPNIMEN